MVDKKRLFVFFVFGMILFSMVGVLASGVGSAESIGEELAEFVKGFGRGIMSFADGLFGEDTLGSVPLSRLFMAILIAMFVYVAFEIFFKGEKYKWIRWIATIAATGLAIIGLPTGFLGAIETNFGTMGGAILAVIPFLIIFWFSVKVESFLMARLVWGIYFVYYIGLYLHKIFTLKGGSWWKHALDGPAFPYLVAGIVGIIAFWKILKIREFVWKGEAQGIGEEIKKKLAVEKLMVKGRRESDKNVVGFEDGSGI